MSSEHPATAKRSDPLRTYLRTSIFGPEQWTEDLFSRHKAAGTSYHDLPFAVRASTYLQKVAVEYLEKSFTITTSNEKLNGTGDDFFYLIMSTTVSKRALEEANELVNTGCNVDHLYRRADLHLERAFDEAITLEASINAIETLLYKMAAMKDSILGLELLLNEETPDPMIEAQLRVVTFEWWAGVLTEWTARVDRYLVER